MRPPVPTDVLLYGLPFPLLSALACALFWYHAADEYPRIPNGLLAAVSSGVFLLMWLGWPGSCWVAALAQVGGAVVIGVAGGIRMVRRD